MEHKTPLWEAWFLSLPALLLLLRVTSIISSLSVSPWCHPVDIEYILSLCHFRGVRPLTLNVASNLDSRGSARSYFGSREQKKGPLLSGPKHSR